MRGEGEEVRSKISLEMKLLTKRKRSSRTLEIQPSRDGVRSTIAIDIKP